MDGGKRRAGLVITAQRHGIDDRRNAWRQCSQCRATGRSGHHRDEAHRHREDGYLEYNRVDFQENKSGVAVKRVVRVFGTVEEADEAPILNGQRAEDIEMNSHLQV